MASGVGCYTKPHESQMLLRNSPYRPLVTARLDRRRQVHEQSGVPGCDRRWQRVDDQLQAYVSLEQRVLLQTPSSQGV